jgi:hypothetical protein
VATLSAAIVRSGELSPRLSWIFRTLLVFSDKDARPDAVALCRWAQDLELQTRSYANGANRRVSLRKDSAHKEKGRLGGGARGALTIARPGRQARRQTIGTGVGKADGPLTLPSALAGRMFRSKQGRATRMVVTGRGRMPLRSDENDSPSPIQHEHRPLGALAHRLLLRCVRARCHEQPFLSRGRTFAHEAKGRGAAKAWNLFLTSVP